jgi:hypothetical protein
MALRRSKKILIPDVPPARTTTYQGVVIASVGALCVSVVIVAVLLVFLGA